MHVQLSLPYTVTNAHPKGYPPVFVLFICLLEASQPSNNSLQLFRKKVRNMTLCFNFYHNFKMVDFELRVHVKIIIYHLPLLITSSTYGQKNYDKWYDLIKKKILFASKINIYPTHF